MPQVIEAARMAQALDFIQALPDGFSSRLGDGGSRLSGGQLQRLALARALLHQPRVSLTGLDVAEAGWLYFDKRTAGLHAGGLLPACCTHRAIWI